MTRRKLGKTQAAVLETLKANRYWYRGCGWFWGSYLETERVMDRLHALGYASRGDEPSPFLDQIRTVYRPMEAA